jgi:hypothetical protein
MLRRGQRELRKLRRRKEIGISVKNPSVEGGGGYTPYIRFIPEMWGWV